MTGATDHSGLASIGASSGLRFHLGSAPLGSVSDSGHTHAASVSAADAHAHPTLSESPEVPSVEALPPYVEVVVCTRQ
ncbi:MAG: hypothetical protein ACKV2T_44015 [Kofleriaceae bacterium]